jgi:rod shape-determining protein MreC
LLFIFVSLALFAFSTLSPVYIQSIRAGAADLLAPVLGLANRPFQLAASYVETATGLANLEVENQKLRDENQRLREWYQTAMQLQAENESLSQLLHVAVEPQNKFVTARVIADSGNSYVKTLLVMAGKQDGIDKGEAVISGEGLIGRTVEVGNKAARVLLVTDINSRVPVIIQGQAQQGQNGGQGGEQDVRAMLAGRNDDMPILLHLPQDTRLQAGARVVTSGNGGVFPFGLPIGVVEATPDGNIGVRLFADTERLIHVRIIDRNDDPNLISSQIPQPGR